MSPHRETSIDYSFVVIAYNEEHFIERCLESIVALRSLGEYEIIVVNDGSTDATGQLADLFARRHPHVRVIHQTNQGRGAARATGLREISGRLVAMVDGDLALSVDWLERCRAEIDRGADVVGGVMVPEGDVTWLHSLFHLDPRPLPLEEGITGGNGLYRAEVIIDIGFDPQMRTAEDIVFRHQLADRGYLAILIPDLICVHNEDKGLLGTIKWMVESGISATHQLRRFRPPRFPDYSFVGWVTLTAFAATWAGWRVATMVTLAWIFMVATGHVRLRFFLRARPTYLARFAAACVTNMVVITPYFIGRLVGFVSTNQIPEWRSSSPSPERVVTSA